MIIKKYEAQTETEAILLAREELGKEAIVLNIKTVKPRGIQRLFRKPNVEITAAVDDSTKRHDTLLQNTNSLLPKEALPAQKAFESGRTKDSEVLGRLEEDNDNAIEAKLNSLQELLMRQLNESSSDKAGDLHQAEQDEQQDKNSECLKAVFDQLVENEVDEKFADQIMNEIRGSLKRETSVDNILTSVYQKIVLKLGEPVFIDLHNKIKKFIFFIGPTGVGKTTTIAKIASQLKLKENAKVALITSDTYRIAAVEQLRTYAGILGIPLSIVYTQDELEQEKEKYEDYDIVLIDTAGRSHKNLEQREDLEKLVNTVSEEEREVFLVLSATTKYKDLIRITENYQIFNEYCIIFTKLDETTSIGNILNIRMLTDAPLSYTTWGQNVPDDFGNIDAQDIAKKLLGGSQ